PGISVEEANLRVHIAVIRKALRDGLSGNRFIANIPGRGYSFVAPVESRQATVPEPEDKRPAAVPHSRTLPSPLTRVIGRQDIVRGLVTKLPQRRFVTIAGPGGIGK